MNRRPYDDYKSSPLWKTVEKALTDLENNNDFERTTDRYYMTGYIVKKIEESKYWKNLSN
jgi:hypothetical protein